MTHPPKIEGLARRLAEIEAAGGTPSGSRPWTRAQYSSELENPRSSRFLWPDPADPRGFVLWRALPPDEAEIMHLAVRDKGRGEGRALLAAFLAAIPSVRRLFLEVAAGNAAAVKLYETAGFLETGRRARYYADGQDARMMVFERS